VTGELLSVCDCMACEDLDYDVTGWREDSSDEEDGTPS
jgi:hypothetical protein